jgi:HAD-superfamily hydrolase, subfamily IIB
MTCRIFVSDLDGTLLNNNHEISAANIDAVKKLNLMGINFMIATGRTKYMVKSFLKELDYNMPLIWCNGAVISDAGGKILYVKEMEHEKVRQAIDIIKKFGMNYVLYTLKGIISEDSGESIKHFEDYNSRVKDEDKAPIVVDRQLRANLDNYTVIKFFVKSADYDRLQRLKDAINERVDGINAVPSQRNILDIVAKGATKGNALLKLSEYMGVNIGDIAAIGDNHNDMDMLKVCGIPLTVENAEDAVKKVALFISKSNDCSGVAYAIDNYICSPMTDKN